MAGVLRERWRLPAGKELRRVALGFAFWTVVALLFALPLLAGAGNVRRTLLGAFLQWWLWGLLSIAIIRVDRALPLRQQHGARWTVQHLLVGVCFSLFYIYSWSFLRVSFRLSASAQLRLASLVNEASRELFWSLLIYFLIVGTSEVVLYQSRYTKAQLRAERMERIASEAKLHNLRSQLDPHFLFNALNGISAYVERDPKLARRMIEHLGDLLRLSLQSQGAATIPLRDEVAFVQQYLALQKMRFGKRLSIHTEIEQDTGSILVPSLLLQPLVENALRHGIGPQLHGGTVCISARKIGARLFLTVADDGIGFYDSGEPAKGSGSGLRLTKERLALLYGTDGSTFQVGNRQAGGAEVTVTLPIVLEEDSPHA